MTKVDKVTIGSCKRLARMIEPDAFKNMNLYNENWKYHRTMLLFLFGTLNGIHNVEELRKATGFKTSTINSVCQNLKENGIWQDGIAYVDLEGENAWMEIVLCTMAAMGELKRELVSSYPVPALPLQLLPVFELMDRKELELTMIEIKQRQVKRDAKPYSFTQIL